MRRGTTPVIVFNTDIDFTQVAELYVTFAQDGPDPKERQVIVEKDKTQCSFDENKIIVSLTQEDTLKFDLDPKDTVYIQIRVKYENGMAMASNILKARVKDILKDGEI